MRHAPSFFIASLLILAYPVDRAIAEDPSPKTMAISGFVMDGTWLNRPVASQEVSLVLEEGGNLQSLARTQTDKAGSFAFSLPAAQGEGAYHVTTVFEGVQYSGAVVGQPQATGAGTAIVKVYQTSADPSELVMDTEHLIIDPVEAGLQVTEMIQVKNSIPYTLLGDRKAPLRFPVPPGARDFHFSGELASDEAWVNGQAVEASLPISPEGRTIVYSYTLPIKGKSLDVAKEATLPIKGFHLLVSVPGTRVTAPGLEEQDPVTIQESQYFHLAGTDLAKGAKIAFRVDNLPETGARVSPVLVVVASIAIIIFALSFPFLRARNRRSRGES